MPRLVTPNGHTLSLPPRRVSVGEAAVNEVPIAQGHGLAAVHFRLQPWESGYFIEDAASGLGTLVNGKVVKWAPLKHGDVITAGGLKMIYEADDAAPVPEFPQGPEAWRQEMPAAGPDPSPPSWLPPEALLPPVSPVAQAAMRQNVPVSGKKGRWRLAAVILLSSGATAAWLFLRR